MKYYRAIRLFLSLAWAKWDKDENGRTVRIDLRTAWQVSKQIWLD